MDSILRFNIYHYTLDLAGYWGLYLVGVQLGHYIFKPKENPVKENGRLSFSYVSKIWNLTALFW